MKMQRANILLAIGGPGNKIPKLGVTAAEVAVLLSMHGQDAVSDIDLLPSLGKDEPSRSPGAELDRLKRTYVGKDQDGKLHVDVVYPGRSPEIHTTFQSLGLPDEAYKATGRKTPGSSAAPAAVVLPMTPAEAFAAEAATGRKAEDHDDYVEAEESGDYAVEGEDDEEGAVFAQPADKAEARAAAQASAEANAQTGQGQPVPPPTEQGAPSKRAPRLGGKAAQTKAEKDAAGTPAETAPSILD